METATRPEMKKSQFAGFLLTLFFGSFGLLYSSVPATVALLVIGFSFALAIAGIVAIIVWLASIVVGFFTVSRWNALNRSTRGTSLGDWAEE